MLIKIILTGLIFGISTSLVSAGTVDNAQSMLNRLGYNAGTVDGAYGAKTRGALEEFYVDNGGSYDGKLDANEITDLLAAINISKKIKDVSGTSSFKPFDCKKLKTKFLRVNKQNNCLIIQELSDEYEVKSQKVDPNAWNMAQLLRYLDNKDGGKIVAHTWNNVVKWGESSNKQPFSHLVVIDVPDLNEIFESNSASKFATIDTDKDGNIFESNLSQIYSNHYTVPLTARRFATIDTDKDGNKEILYLGNREDGRNRNSSWKDVNFIFDLDDNSLSEFGSPHFSHDLMYFDFNNDGYFEILDYFYGAGKPTTIEVCDLKTNKCKISKNASQFVDIGFNHLMPSKDGAIIFGGCPSLGNTTFCWSKVTLKNGVLKFTKLDDYKLKPKPTAEADFLLWTGDVGNKPGYWVEGSNKKQFKMADRSWMSTTIDFNKDGFIDTVAIEKEVVCTRNNISKPFNRSGGDCVDEAYMNIFKNVNDEKFEKHQVLPTKVNSSFRIEKADINKDGTIDLYGFRQGYYNPWMACKYSQLNSLYLNINNEYLEQASEKFIEENFGLYGCERMSNFFEKDGQYYRLFITIPDEESKVAYLGIENYTAKITQVDDLVYR